MSRGIEAERGLAIGYHAAREGLRACYCVWPEFLEQRLQFPGIEPVYQVSQAAQAPEDLRVISEVLPYLRPVLYHAHVGPVYDPLDERVSVIEGIYVPYFRYRLENLYRFFKRDSGLFGAGILGYVQKQYLLVSHPNASK